MGDQPQMLNPERRWGSGWEADIFIQVKVKASQCLQSFSVSRGGLLKGTEQSCGLFPKTTAQSTNEGCKVRSKRVHCVPSCLNVGKQLNSAGRGVILGTRRL